MTKDFVWLVHPTRQGEPKMFEAKPEILVPAMVAGWAQCEPPAHTKEVNIHVND